MLCRRCIRVFTSSTSTLPPHTNKSTTSTIPAVNTGHQDKPSRPEVKRERSLHPMLSIPVVCFALGVWQIQRRKAKLKLIADMDARRDAEPVPFHVGEVYEEYIPVIIRGKYDYRYEFHLGPRHNVIDNTSKGNAAGYHSIVPMVLESGERILVDRGWIATRTGRPEGRIKGMMDLTGYIRHDEEAVMAILAPPVGSTTTYIWRDGKNMAQISGCLPITVELFGKHSVQGGPIAGQTRLSVYNKHVEYIITWFGLGIVSLFYVFRFRRTPKRVPKVFKAG